MRPAARAACGGAAGSGAVIVRTTPGAEVTLRQTTDGPTPDVCVTTFPADQNDFLKIGPDGSLFAHAVGTDVALTVVSGGVAYVGTGHSTGTIALTPTALSGRLHTVGTVSDGTTTYHVVCRCTVTPNGDIPVNVVTPK